MERQKSAHSEKSKVLMSGLRRCLNEILWGSLLTASAVVALATIWALWQIIYHQVALEGILARDPLTASSSPASGWLTELMVVYALPVIFGGLACAAAYVIDRRVRYKAALLVNGLGLGLISTAVLMLLVAVIYPPPSDLAEIAKYGACGLVGGAYGAWLAYRSNQRYDGQRKAMEQLRRPASSQHIVRVLGGYLSDADLRCVALWQPTALSPGVFNAASNKEGRNLELAEFWPEARPEEQRAMTADVGDVICADWNFENEGMVTVPARTGNTHGGNNRVNRWLLLPLLGGREGGSELIGVLAVGLHKRILASRRISWRLESYWRTIAAGVASELEHVQHLQQTVVRERVLRRRDMHDGPKQDLFSLQMKLAEVLSSEDLERTEPKAGSGASVAALVEEALEAGERAAQDLTRMMQRLPPRELENSTLGEVLRREVEQQFRDTQTEYEVLVERPEESAKYGVGENAVASGLSPAAEEALYRCAKEALANVYKHADAKHVSMTLRYTQNSVLVWVSDDGRGFVADKTAEAESIGEGLVNMDHRMWEVGGTVSVNATPGSGTAVIIAIGTQTGPEMIQFDETSSHSVLREESGEH